MSIDRSRSQSFSRSLSSTRRFVRRQVWLWPIIAALILGPVGWVLRGMVENAVKQTMAENLDAILAADVAALQFWLATQRDNATAIASDADVQQLVRELVAAADDPQVDNLQLAGMSAQQALLSDIEPWFEAHDYEGDSVVDKTFRIVASDHLTMIGRDDLPIPAGLIDKVFAGETVVTPPFKSAVQLPDEQGVMKSELPTMFAVAPVRDADEAIIALLGLRINPTEQFT